MHRDEGTQIPVATMNREFRTFLLMAQFQAKEIGGRIAQARKESGLTQEELAEMASFSKRSLQDYETGITIPYRQIREIGKLLDRPTEWFLHGDTTETSIAPEAVMVRIDELVDLVTALDRKLDVAGVSEERLQSIERELRSIVGALQLREV